MAKKDPNKFTILFCDADPLHQQVIDILNLQGRRKAQFIVNAIQHYLHCSETPDIPQPAPVDTAAIETIVRRIMEEQSSRQTPPETKQEPVKRTVKSEQIDFGDAADLLGEEGVAAIRNTMANFRR